MASTITRPPRGLLSLLGTKTLGRNPDALSELVRPIVNLTPNYLLDQNLEVETASVVGGAIGAFAFVQVTEGEVWAVENVTAEYLCAVAGETPSFQARVRGTTGSNIIYTLAESQVSFAPTIVNQTQHCQVNFNPAALFVPALRIEVFNNRTVNGATVFTIRVAFRRLRI